MNTQLQIDVACALIALLGVPLLLRRVKPNRIYGLATQRTLADAAAWYDVNAFLGWALIASSAVTALGLSLMPQAYRWSAALSLAIFLVPLAIAFGATFAFLRRHGSRRATPPSSGTDP